MLVQKHFRSLEPCPYETTGSDWPRATQCVRDRPRTRPGWDYGHHAPCWGFSGTPPPLPYPLHPARTLPTSPLAAHCTLGILGLDAQGGLANSESLTGVHSESLSSGSGHPCSQVETRSLQLWAPIPALGVRVLPTSFLQ